MTYGEEWHHQRSVTVQILRRLGYGKTVLEGQIVEEAHHAKNHILSFNGEPMDPNQALNVSVANIMCKLIFGQSYSVGDQELVTLINAVEDITDSDYEAETADAMSSSAYKRAVKRGLAAYDVIENFFRRKVEEAMIIVKAPGFDSPSNFIEGYLYNLETPMEEDQRISENQVTSICIDLFMAAAESTNVSLKWGLLYMAVWPDILTKVQAEMDAVFQKQPHTFSLSDKEKLPYLEATIMEIQRRSTVAALTLYHSTIEDVQIYGYSIKKDTAVSITSLCVNNYLEFSTFGYS